MSLLNEYVKSIVGKLNRDAEEKEQMKLEIKDHLMSTRSEYLSKGYESRDAEKCAIFDFVGGFTICHANWRCGL
jgi:hypothetical protein